MVRRRRIALAATASSVLVAGALTALALAVTSGSAGAAPSQQCSGTGTPVTCGWTSANPIDIALPLCLMTCVESTSIIVDRARLSTVSSIDETLHPT